MLSILRLKLIRRFYLRRFVSTILFSIFVYLILLSRVYSGNKSNNSTLTTIKYINGCHFKPSTSEFILQYKSNVSVGDQSDFTRVEPTVERIRSLLEIIRSKEDKYQSLLETFDVFNILNPTISLKAYTDESNIDEIKSLYDRYIKLMPDKKMIQIDPTFIDYLRKISSYLSDGLRNHRTNQVNKKKKYFE